MVLLHTEGMRNQYHYFGTSPLCMATMAVPVSSVTSVAKGHPKYLLRTNWLTPCWVTIDKLALADLLEQDNVNCFINTWHGIAIFRYSTSLCLILQTCETEGHEVELKLPYDLSPSCNSINKFIDSGLMHFVIEINIGDTGFQLVIYIIRLYFTNFDFPTALYLHGQ